MVEFYLSIDKNIRYFTTLNKCEKYLIRQSFSAIYKDLVPESILWRTKEAFSDGVSSLNRSWYEIIDEKIKSLMLYDENISKQLNEKRRIKSRKIKQVEQVENYLEKWEDVQKVENYVQNILRKVEILIYIKQVENKVSQLKSKNKTVNKQTT